MDPGFEQALRQVHALHNEGVLTEDEFKDELSKIAVQRDQAMAAEASLALLAERENRLQPVASIRSSKTACEKFVVEASMVTVPGTLLPFN